jgi:hypothetical protein
MDARTVWKSKGALFVGVLGVVVGAAANGAEHGTTTGVASFQAKGEAKNYKPAVTVWDGTFVGVSVTDTRKGPLHNSGWDCTGEQVIQDGNSFRAGGFCVITDPDGDTINLLWERTNTPGPVPEPKTKGTYLSGTGKYSGIQGYYTFACRQGGTVCSITAGDYKIP